MWYQKKGNKYGAKKSEFQGRSYMSKKEAQYAQELEFRKLAKEIKKITPQHRLSLDVNGYHIANYYIDFLIEMKDGSKELHEVKGFATEVWRLKWKLCEALYGDKYRMVLIK